MTGPGPTAAELDVIIATATRVPDHGKLRPWRFIVFEGDARLKAGAAIEAAFREKYPEAKPEQLEYERKRLARARFRAAAGQTISVRLRVGPRTLRRLRRAGALRVAVSGVGGAVTLLRPR